MGSPPASSRCSGWWRPGARTARSRPHSSSASTPWHDIFRTSSASSGSPPGPRRRPTPSNIASPDAPTQISPSPVVPTLVGFGDDPARPAFVWSCRPTADREEEQAMYVVVQHTFLDPREAFSRGEKLIKEEGAPDGTTGLQFYPAQDGSGATCLWE